MTSEPDPPETRVTRRASLARFGGLLVAGLGAGAGLTESATAGSIGCRKMQIFIRLAS